MLGKLKPQSGPDLENIIDQINSFTSEGNLMSDAEQKAHGHSLGMIENMMHLCNVIMMPRAADEIRYKGALKNVSHMRQRILNRRSEHLGPETDDFDIGVSNLTTDLMSRLQQAMILENPNHINQINKTFPKFEDKPTTIATKAQPSGSLIGKMLKKAPDLILGLVVASTVTNAITNAFSPIGDEGVSEKKSKVEYVDFRGLSHCVTLGYTEADCAASWEFAQYKQYRMPHTLHYNLEDQCTNVHGRFECAPDDNPSNERFSFEPIALSWRAAANNILDPDHIEPLYSAIEYDMRYLSSGDKIQVTAARLN